MNAVRAQSNFVAPPSSHSAAPARRAARQLLIVLALAAMLALLDLVLLGLPARGTGPDAWLMALLSGICPQRPLSWPSTRVCPRSYTFANDTSQGTSAFAPQGGNLFILQDVVNPRASWTSGLTSSPGHVATITRVDATHVQVAKENDNNYAYFQALPLRHTARGDASTDVSGELNASCAAGSSWAQRCRSSRGFGCRVILRRTRMPYLSWH